MFSSKIKIYKPLIESNILANSGLIKSLVDLCRFDINQSQFHLLYRSSRDGFGSFNFHSRCDDHPNTIMLVETTKGYIFGGFTHARWFSNSRYRSDPYAFLFSLLNRFGKPFWCQVKVPSHAINSYMSPSFGQSDICVDFHSNDTNASGYSVLNTYAKPHCIQPDDVEYFQNIRHYLFWNK